VAAVSEPPGLNLLTVFACSCAEKRFPDASKHVPVLLDDPCVELRGGPTEAPVLV